MYRSVSLGLSTVFSLFMLVCFQTEECPRNIRIVIGTVNIRMCLWKVFIREVNDGYFINRGLFSSRSSLGFCYRIICFHYSNSVAVWRKWRLFWGEYRINTFDFFYKYSSIKIHTYKNPQKELISSRIQLDTFMEMQFMVVSLHR